MVTLSQKAAVKSESTVAFNKQIAALQAFLNTLDELDSNISDQIGDLDSYADAKQQVSIDKMPEQLDGLIKGAKRLHTNISIANFYSIEELSKQKHALSMPSINMVNGSYSYDIRVNDIDSNYSDLAEYIHSFSDDDIDEYKGKGISENISSYLQTIINQYSSEKKNSGSSGKFQGSDLLWNMVENFEQAIDGFLFDLHGQLEEAQNYIEPLSMAIEKAIEGYKSALQENLEEERKQIHKEKETEHDDRPPGYKPGDFRQPRFITVRNPYSGLDDDDESHQTRNNRTTSPPRFNTQRKSIVSRDKAFEIMNRAIAQLGKNNGSGS